jgi:hypothetical protein
MPAAVLLPAVLAAVGCTKPVPVTRYPTFYEPSLETVGVIRFRNRSGNARAGLLMARAVARALEANGTYEVLSPVEVHRMLSDPSGMPDPNRTVSKWVQQLRGKGAPDAILTGAVLAYEAGQYSMPDSTVSVGTGVGYGHGYAYPYRHYRSGFYGYRSWPVTYRVRREAAVSVKVTLTRVSDGQTLYTTAEPVRMRLDSSDVEGDIPGEEMLGMAADQAAGLVADRIAPSRVTLKLDPDKTLRTADRFNGGAYDFHPGETIYAVLSLPNEADRNTFRLAIIQKEGATELASKEIVWDRAAEKRSVTFKTDKLLEDAGAGQYLLKLYSGRTFVFERDFEIKSSR